MDDEGIITAELRRLVAIAKDDPLRDLDNRIAMLRAASRATEPLTEGREATAQGHILSAITKLERRLAELRRNR